MFSATNLKVNLLVYVFHIDLFAFSGDLNLRCQNWFVCLFFNPGVSNLLMTVLCCRVYPHWRRLYGWTSIFIVLCLVFRALNLVS